MRGKGKPPPDPTASPTPQPARRNPTASCLLTVLGVARPGEAKGVRSTGVTSSLERAGGQSYSQEFLVAKPT